MLAFHVGADAGACTGFTPSAANIALFALRAAGRGAVGPVLPRASNTPQGGFAGRGGGMRCIHWQNRDLDTGFACAAFGLPSDRLQPMRPCCTGWQKRPSQVISAGGKNRTFSATSQTWACPMPRGATPIRWAGATAGPSLLCAGNTNFAGAGSLGPRMRRAARQAASRGPVPRLLPHPLRKGYHLTKATGEAIWHTAKR